eukprot:Platyproteum_vivax@DN7475_c1_g2_i6.p1
MKLYLTILVFGLLNCVHSLENRALRVRNRLESAKMRAHDPSGADNLLITYKKEGEKDLRIVVGNVSEKFGSAQYQAGELTAVKDQLSADGYRFISAEPQRENKENAKADMRFDSANVRPLSSGWPTISTLYPEPGRHMMDMKVQNTLENLQAKLIPVLMKGEEPEKPQSFEGGRTSHVTLHKQQ